MLRRRTVNWARNNDALISLSSRMWRLRSIGEWPSVFAKLWQIQTPKSIVRRSAPSPSGDSNVNIIFRLIESTRNVPGSIAECGVFLGASIIPAGVYLEQHGIEKRVYGFDSFEGFDASVAIDLALGGAETSQKRHGGFNEASYERLLRKVRCFGLGGRIELVKGYFNDTLPRYADRNFAFVHLDCDIYESYKECLEFFYPRLSPGGAILFDEYNDPPWPGCNKAIDEFFDSKAEKPQMIESDGYQKWFVRKPSES